MKFFLARGGTPTGMAPKVVRRASAWWLDRVREGWLTGGGTLRIHMKPEPPR
jgi:hypothetical protein